MQEEDREKLFDAKLQQIEVSYGNNNSKMYWGFLIYIMRAFAI